MPLGDTPYINRGDQVNVKRIFFSKSENAALIPITIPGGCGIIPAGAVMGLITESTNRVGQYMPYTPVQPVVGATVYRGGAFLTLDGAASTVVQITLADSYRFASGDHLAVADNDSYNASAVDLGAITAIDRTTYSHIAVLTVTNNVTTAMTVAQGALVWIQTKTTTPYLKAKGYLAGAVDTGVGENAKGGSGTLVIGRAELYSGLLENHDSNVLTDVGGTAVNNLITF